MKNKNQKGAIIMMVIVFGGIFLLLFGGLSGLIFFQLRQSLQKWAWTESLEIAEAGIDFAKWCQNHGIDPVLEKDFFDPQGNKVGAFSLQILSTTACDETVNTEILSTGWTQDFPDIQRTIKTILGQASVGQYAYLLNDNVWAGADREVRGYYHSNGGVRMDGENQSIVSSAQESWVCTDSFGCNYWDCPDDCTAQGNACLCPGVFTTTGNSSPDLFFSPAPLFDFEGITIDLANIKNLVFAFPQEKYWPPVNEIDANGLGYDLKLKNTGQFEVWIITDLDDTYAYSLEQGWHDDYFIIENEYLYSTHYLDLDCSLLFFEDNLWVQGKIKGKATIVSADLINPTKDTNVVLSHDIEYTTLDGSDGLALVGQNNVLIGPDSLDTMELRGIFVAQKGHFGRNHYPWNLKEKLEIYGSIMSNGRVGTKWTSGSVVISGYSKRENYIDSNLIYSAPPFVPSITPDFEIIHWEEVE